MAFLTVSMDVRLMYSKQTDIETDADDDWGPVIEKKPVDQ